MTQLLSQREQRRGGQDGRSALVAYLRTDVAGYLGGRFPDHHTRQEMFTAAGELAYLAGWTAFDSSEHALAQKWLGIALRLSAEADDAPLAGHILRAQAHQTLDLGHPTQALRLAEASVARRRYTDASPRERSLLGVVHARSLAAAGHKQQAVAALLRAEDDLRHAESGDGEPARVFFFSEASLAHETARTLQGLGDLRGAEREFQRSVRTRRAQPFARTHAVTLGLLGAVRYSAELSMRPVPPGPRPWTPCRGSSPVEPWTPWSRCAAPCLPTEAAEERRWPNSTIGPAR